MNRTPSSSVAFQRQKTATRSQLRRRTNMAWLLSLVAHSCVLTVIGVLLNIEWITPTQSSFAWKVQFVQLDPPPPPSPPIRPASQPVRKRTVDAAPPPQPLIQTKRQTSHRLRQMKARSGQQGSVPIPSPTRPVFSDTPAHASIPHETARPAPPARMKKEAQLTAHLTSPRPTRQPSPLPQTNLPRANTIHSQSAQATNNTTWSEGIRHTTQQEPDFSVTGQTRIAPATDPQALKPRATLAHTPQQADFGWLVATLHEKVQRLKQYPARAKRQSLEGQVTVRATITRNGLLGNLVIERSSGHHLLDQNALQTVKQAFPLDFQEQLHQPQVVLLLPINYTLQNL
ncbi:TonB family protein [Nitrospira sp. M1]